MKKGAHAVQANRWRFAVVAQACSYATNAITLGPHDMRALLPMPAEQAAMARSRPNSWEVRTRLTLPRLTAISFSNPSMQKMSVRMG
ncbi:hypothetical protein [Caballeronia grimmiae]|uniref:hypothetical protein n=1 Tax=Caballeronia grimmiae TaxID=1071679 RepID=UPI0038BBD999